MDVIDSSEWEAAVQVGLEVVVVEVPEFSREAARDSVDLRPYVRVRSSQPVSPELLDEAREVGLAAMLGRQQQSSL